MKRVRNQYVAATVAYLLIMTVLAHVRGANIPKTLALSLVAFHVIGAVLVGILALAIKMQDARKKRV